MRQTVEKKSNIYDEKKSKIYDVKKLNRLKRARAVVCLALLAGVLYSQELWFPVARTFPRAPVWFYLPENAVSTVERSLAVILTISLAAAAFVRRPAIFLAAALAALAAAIFFDQTRLQPWVYQYFLLLVVLALGGCRTESDLLAKQTLGLLQIVCAGLYFWSGVQKLNFTFFNQTLPFLLAPVQNVFPNVQLPVFLLGFGVAAAEIFIGCGLLVRKIRRVAVPAALVAHAVILVLLIGNDYNRVVWIWNAALMLLVIILFARSDASIKRAFAPQGGGWKTKAAKFVAAAAIVLPALSFVGWWDAYLSGALYSGNTQAAALRIDDKVYDRLPPAARQSVFRMTSGERILGIFEWAMTDLNVPPNPEPRIFERAARSVCRLATDKTAVELVVKQRPAIFDGKYEVTRKTCAELERQP